MKKTLILLFVIVATAILSAQQPQAPMETAVAPPPPSTSAEAKTDTESLVIPKGATVFIAPMPDKFDEFMKTAIEKKQVPVKIVEKREDADFEITGYSESQKASTAKKLIMGSWHSRESASIKVANLKSGVVAFAYSYNNDNSNHGKRTSSEACAKHLKEKIENGK